MPAVLTIVFVVGAPLLIIVANHLFTVAADRDYKGFGQPDLPDALSSEKTWVDVQEFEDVSIQSADGLSLQAYYLAAPEPTSRVAILAHGYRGSAKKDMGAYAEFYHEQLGYNVLMPDARAHGASEGRYIGFGWLERKDYLRWIDQMVERHGPRAAIVLHGVSMGGATVMMTAGENLPYQVKCIVEDCGYTTAEEELAYQLKRMYRLPAVPLLSITSLITRLRAGYSLSEASAIRQIEHTTRPVLFIHGREDSFVPTEMVYRLHAACSTPKELLIVPGAEHPMSIVDDPETYVRTVGDFLDRWIPNGDA